jgi:5'-3' exonuclease
MNKLLENYGDLNVFIDSGYLNYYTIYGAFNMWKRMYKDRYKQRCPDKPTTKDLPNLCTDDRFIMCLEKKLQMNLDKMFNVVRTKVFDGYTPPGIKTQFYFCNDSKPYWRKTDLYPEYKMQRGLSGKFFDTSKAFNYLLGVIIPKMDVENYFGIKTLEVQYAEADDIIMTLIKRMRHTHNVIFATDHDYIQVLNKAKQFDLIGNQITTKTIAKKLVKDENVHITPEEYLNVKCIQGDGSDNIPAIYDRCGPKTAYKLMQNPKLLRERLIEQGQQAVNQLDLNRKLIDCNNIPLQLQKEIVYEYSRVKAC